MQVVGCIGGRSEKEEGKLGILIPAEEVLVHVADSTG
jgi:hypothetical protein